MLRITGNNYNSIYKRNVAFGNTEYEDFGYEKNKSKEELKAEQLEALARKIAESDSAPSALRSFAVVTTLMTASALTGAAASGRLFNFLNQVGALKKITPLVSVGIEKASAKLSKLDPQEGFKGALIEGIKNTINALESTSKSGIEESLSKLNKKKAMKLSAIKRSLKKNNPELKENKQLIQDTLDKVVAENQEYKTIFTQIQNDIHEAKGSNLSKKATKATTATVMGIGALKEASRDADQNGVPDCVEFSKSKREATQKLTAAILDCALDSF